ncbi:AMP-binding protein [Nostoc sp. CCY 9925]|uniref:AMP-binding protein n=1 Tax=Nostoc sp. CCY 9925 TaxID=3103865 RepID=UPI0039C6FED7
MTSGSTGKPKGVSIIHRGVVRLVKAANYAHLTPAEVFLQLAPISFDASTFEIWGCLLNGGRLVVSPAHTPSLEELGQIIPLLSLSGRAIARSLMRQSIQAILLEKNRPCICY